MPEVLKPFIENDPQGRSDFLSILLENNNEMVILLNKDLHVLFRSPSATRISGWTDQEIVTTDFTKLPFHPDDADYAKAQVMLSIDNPSQVIPLMFRLAHKDGHYIHVEGSVRNLLNDERVKALLLNTRDVTSFVEKQQILQLYVENNPAAIAMFDTNMRYIVASNKWLTDYHLIGQNIIGRSHYEIFPEITDEWKAIHKHCLKGNTEKREEDQFVRADGSTNWLRWEVKPWFNSNGICSGIIIFTEDITFRKKIERKIIENEQKYRSLVERISDGFVSLDTEWRFAYVNKRAEEFLDRKATDLIGNVIWDVLPESKGGPFYHAYYEAMSQQKNIHLEGISQTLQIPVHVSAYPSQTGLSIFFRDMREEAKAKAEKKESDDKFKSLVERISDGFIALDNNWKYVYANHRAEEMFGRTNEYLVGKNIWDVYPNAVNGPFYQAYNKAMQTQEHVAFVDYSHYGKIWLEVNVYPSPTGLTIYFKNINERVEAELAAKKSEVIRQAIMSSALDAIICINEENEILFWNTQSEKLFGWKQEEVIGAKLQNTVIPIRLKARHTKGYKRYIETGEGKIINRLVEIAAVNKSGHEFPIELFVVKIDNPDKPFFCAFIRDISDRKQKETDLLKVNKRLKDSQEIAHIGTVEIDYINNKSFWSEETQRIYGVENAKTEFTVEDWFSYIHPEDLEYVTQLTAQMAKEDRNFSFYHRIIRPSGEVRYILVATRREHDKKNSGHMYAVIHDITEIKKLELELLKQKETEQKKITSAIIKAQEKERNAIGEELHDNINQILTGVYLQLSRIEEAAPEILKITHLSMDYLKNAIQENRKISRELVIPDFEHVTLSAQLEHLAEYMFDSNAIQLHFSFDTFNESLLNDDQKLTIYRITQEQFTNIQKYAKATEVSFTLSQAKNLLKMIIADNGIGMNKKTLATGIGLRNIKSRLSILNGSVQVKTEPGKGFSLEVSFPVGKKE